MGCSYKWTTLLTLVILHSKITIFCQNISGGQKYPVENINKEQKISNNVSSKSQLMNTLLTVAAANGVLPDLLPVIQPTLSNDVSQYQSANDIPNSLNLIQLSPNIYQKPKESIVVTGKAVTPINQSSQPILLSSCIPVASTQPYAPFHYSYIQPPHLQVYPGPQAVKLENSPNTNSYQSTSTIQTVPAIWQPQTTMNEISRDKSANIQIQPTNPSQQVHDDANIEDILHPSIEVPSDILESSLPVNLQINLPAQNIPAPKITVVSAAPTNAPTAPSTYPFSPYYPPPIIVDKSDSLNSWLPMILIALFANDRGNCGSNCGCTCCCPCSKSNNAIPIPYPIPIPINSPIITTSGGSKAKLRTQQSPSSASNEDDGLIVETEDGDNHNGYLIN